MTCPGCHADNAPEAALCARCGHSLTPTLEVRAGTILAGRYEIRQLLGKGGMGTVFLAHDRLLDEAVALKVLRSDADQAPEAVQRFIQEIKLARSVSHRNVCRIHEYGEDRGIRYISMACVEGVELRAILHEGGALPALEAVEFAIGVAEGLHAIHEEGIVHRDLKPANIMVDKKGVVHLMDFGIAKASSAPGMTASGNIIGTPEYMSPEQIRGGRLDRRSDVYSLGVVLYELLTGAVPFHGDTPVATILKHLQEPAPLDALALVHLPEPLRRILAKALAKDPEARYATALELARALQAARHRLATAPTLAREQATREIPIAERAAWRAVTPRPPPARRAPPRGGVAAWRSAALAVAGLGATVALTARLLDRPAGAPEASAIPATAPPPSVTLPAPSEAPVPAPTVETTAAPAATPAPASPRPRPAAPSPPAPELRSAEPQRRAPAVEPRLARLLADAELALLGQKYERAMELYDQALALEPGSETARRGRATALDARVRAQLAAAPSAPPPGVRLVAGTTTASSPETRTENAFEEEFEAPKGGEVTRATQSPVLPGRIEFEVQPERLLGGQPYVIRILLRNTGRAPIDVAALAVSTVANNRKVEGPLPPLVRQVGPGQRATLRELSDFWGDSVQSWTLEATVITSRHETYKNTLALQTRP